MHILIATYCFWPEQFIINEMAEALVQRGHQVSVLTGVPNYPQGAFYPGYGWFRPFRETWRGVRIYRAPNLPRGTRRGDKKRLLLNYLTSCASASLVAPWFATQKIDCVLVYATSPITTTFPAWIASRVARVPLYIWLQDPWPESVAAASNLKNPKVLSTISHYVRWIYARCKLLLIQSPAFRIHASEHGVGEDKIRDFPNSNSYLPLSTQSTVQAETYRQTLSQHFSVVYAGNIGEAQDLETILDTAMALRADEKIHWFFIGEGSKRPWLLENIQKRGLQDRFTLWDPVPRSELNHILEAASCCLVTLKNEPALLQTIPSKLQYYLQQGKPILCVLGGAGARLAYQCQAAKVCEPGDSQACAKAITELRGLPQDQLLQLGSAGQAYYQAHFDGSRLLDKLLEWIQT